MQTERKFVFTWLDLIAPWGVCLGSATLCAWAAISGQPMGMENPLVPKIISWVVAAMFLAGIPLWYLVRSRVRKADYFTDDGVAMVLGKLNRPAKEDVEAWSKRVREHWLEKKWSYGEPPVTGPVKTGQIDLAFRTLTCFCFDKDKLTIWNRLVRGWCTGKDIGIGYQAGKPEYTESLYVHESSHSVLDQTSLPWNETVHHQLFKDTGLGA